MLPVVIGGTLVGIAGPLAMGLIRIRRADGAIRFGGVYGFDGDSSSMGSG